MELVPRVERLDGSREGREAMKVRGVEEMRLNLMGVGLPLAEQTTEKKRLRTLVMAAPLFRRFDFDRPDARELEQLQLEFLEARISFITAQNEEELWRLAAELINTDSHLSRNQSVAHLRYDVEDIS